jgi:predicted dehydrogenase
MSRLRLAVVGVGAEDGSRARGYLATIKKLGHLYDLCALCDAGESALKTAGATYGVDALYSNVETMLTQEKPDALFVLVPTDGQTVVALNAIRHGCHLITEIPYALTLSMGDAIHRAAQEKGLKWEVAENVWLWPKERLKQKIVREGLLGQLTHARLSYPAGSYHGLNAIRMILGLAPTRAQGYAQATEVTPYKNYGGGDETRRWWESGIIEFENDVSCVYEMPTSPGARGGFHWDIEGKDGYLSDDDLVLYNDGNQGSYAIKEEYEEIGGEQVLSAVSVDTNPVVRWENPYREYLVSGADDVAKAAILESLHTAVTQDTEPIYGMAGGRLDYEMWVAVRESAGREGQWVDLPLEKTTDLESRIHDEFVRYYGGDPVEDSERLLTAKYGRLSAMWTIAGWL